MDRRLIGVTAAALMLSSAIYCLVLWQPERQVRLHQRNFLKAAEKRNWERLGEFVAADYSDRWGHDKEIVVQQAREALRQFLFLTLAQEERTPHVDGGTGISAGRLAVDGSGGPLAELVKQRVNSLAEPFTFHWQQQSWKPWDWQLIRVEQPELEVDGAFR